MEPQNPGQPTPNNLPPQPAPSPEITPASTPPQPSVTPQKQGLLKRIMSIFKK